ncbi:MAG TPA: hypothetical protein VNN08_05255 [Thermoanaerobaculia bacterium]|nr:hypothetical protein [Thermoanaerobaculia bacterium]
MWNIASHTYEEIAATRQFVSAAACDKARGAAVRENAALADFIRTTKIDTSMVPNRFGDCHCDRTQETSSAAFLNATTRTAQLRAQQDAAWSLRERLLGQNVPGVADHLNSLFGHPPAPDRFLRETLPARLLAVTSVRTPAKLLESTIGAQTSTPAIAANLSLVPVPSPVPLPAAPLTTQPAAAKPPAQPPDAQPPAASPPVPAPASAEPHPPLITRRKQ